MVSSDRGISYAFVAIPLILVGVEEEIEPLQRHLDELAGDADCEWTKRCR
jgi:hypothetical protein